MLQPRTVVGGRYEIIRKIAEGGMGSVHEAVHLLSKRVVALKLLAPDVARDETKRQRFLREVAAPAQIGHDGIVEIFDAGYDDKLGLLFVAMELLQGETLRERITRLDPARNPGARETLLDLFDRMLEPLAAAHARGIVHRDLKPENVFVHRRRDGAEVVKILDFGIARELDTSAPSVTQTGIAMGTPHYMSPEQAMNAREASFPADVWSLGAMLYEILSGDTPFQGDAAGSIIAAAVTQAHPPLGSVAAGTSPALAELVDRCLAKRPEDRPRDAMVLLEELRRARGRAASTVSPLTPTPPPGSLSPAFAAGSPQMTGPMAMTPAPASAPGAYDSAAVSSAAQAVGPTLLPGATPVPNTSAPTVAIGSALVSPTFATPGSMPGATPGSMPGSMPGAAPEGSGSRRWLAMGIGAAAVVFGGGLCCVTGAVGLGLLGNFGQSDATPRLGATPITWRGELSPNDRVDRQRYFDTYSFQVGAGERFSVELSSRDFDSVLRLGTPSGGALENDDYSAGMTLDARIDVPSSEAGTYTVHVTSYGPQARGTYLVIVRH